MAPRRRSEHILTDRLQRLARERAGAEARRIPWQRLLEARKQYLEWQEFYFWVRAILEVEGSIPEWLVEILDRRCPGFVSGEMEVASEAVAERPLPLRLEDWIENHIFGFAKQEGWFHAIAFYAIRDPHYQRAEVCWSESVARWKTEKPHRYPSLEEWGDAVALCDDSVHLLSEVQKARASTKLVDRDRLAAAVIHYIDLEALAYWARPALELAGEMPDVVAAELRRRCPGFLDTSAKETQGAADRTREWDRFIGFIAEHYFQEAEAGGWLDAIRIEARNHPRAIRTIEYAEHCEELWDADLPDPYPTFEKWRSDADAYVETFAAE